MMEDRTSFEAFLRPVLRERKMNYADLDRATGTKGKLSAVVIGRSALSVKFAFQIVRALGLRPGDLEPFISPKFVARSAAEKLIGPILREKGLYQEDLAKLSGIPKGSLDHIFSDRYSLTAENALKIKNALELPDDFFSDFPFRVPVKSPERDFVKKKKPAIKKEPEIKQPQQKLPPVFTFRNPGRSGSDIMDVPPPRLDYPPRGLPKEGFCKFPVHSDWCNAVKQPHVPYCDKHLAVCYNIGRAALCRNPKIIRSF